VQNQFSNSIRNKATQKICKDYQNLSIFCHAIVDGLHCYGDRGNTDYIILSALTVNLQLDRLYNFTHAHIHVKVFSMVWYWYP